MNHHKGNPLDLIELKFVPIGYYLDIEISTFGITHSQMHLSCLSFWCSEDVKFAQKKLQLN